MAQGNGVSINVGANTQQATTSINKLQQALGNFGKAGKGLFSGQQAQSLVNYSRHLKNLENSLDRATLKVKGLTAAQRDHARELGKMSAAGIGPESSQYRALQRAMSSNNRNLSFWQGRQASVTSQMAYAHANQPGIGGGGGGAAGWLIGQGQNLASGFGGGLFKALGIGAITGGLAALAGKAAISAINEQKEFADVMPGLRLGKVGGSKVGGFMNNFRNKSLPLGYSGLEALKVAHAMSPGSSNAGIQNDSQTAMAMGRMFGIDAGGQASMLAEGGKMGAFRPGDAKRFANMLAREISTTGLGPRAQEVQEATLMLLHQQASGSGTTNPAAALAMQSVLSKTGIPGLQGQMGASLISHMNQTFGGAEDDATVAFQEGMLRDQRGVKGYYAMRKAKERIQYGKDPRYLGDAVKQAYAVTNSGNAAEDLLSRVLGVPMILLEEIGKHTKGGLRGLTPGKFTAAQKWLGKPGGDGGVLAGGLDAMKLPGNEVRQIESAFTNAMARAGNPAVKGLADLGAKAVRQIQKLNEIADSTKSLDQKIGSTVEVGLTALGVDPKSAKAAGKATAAGARTGAKEGGAVLSLQPSGDADTTYHPPSLPLNAQWDAKSHTWYVPGPKGGKKGGVPVLPPVNGIGPAGAAGVQRGSNDVNLHITFDKHGAIHPHVKHQFIAMVEEAADEIHRKNTKSGLHHRYSRIG